jgi:hypothetical protein
MKLGSHISCSRECLRAWGNEPHTPKWAPTLGVRLSIDFRWTFESSKGNYRGSKVIGLKIFLYHWKALRTYMFKMGSHDPFGDLKHKLWPKEGVGNQIANLTPNHQKSGIALISLSASGLSHILGKISSRAIILLETSSQSEVFKQSMGLQNCGSPNLGNFGIPTWESRDKMTFGC